MLFKKIPIIILIVFLTLNITSASLAQSVSEIQNKINSQNEKIKQLNQEIAAYQKQLDEISSQAESLQNAIKTLDINQKKIQAEISKIQTDIEKTNLIISNLGVEIGDAETKIDSNTDAISKVLNEMRQSDEKSLLESFLGGSSLTQVLDEYESISQFQQKVRQQSKELALHKNNLQDRKIISEREKKKLVSLKSELNDQNQILANNKKEKSALLNQTKNKESEYKKIVAEKIAQMEQFQKELYEFESQLKITIDPNSYPAPKNSVLDWPLDNIRITQLFGITADSARLYRSGTHNGVDFGASVGTPIKASLSGAVQAFGNTDEQRGCYSYGKWVLIKHNNGLSTLYAHLSVIKVSVGQQVSAGQIIAYSGNTGFSTGPHLHFTVYASQGVRIEQYTKSINCKNVIIPIADPKAYLDPILYLPKL